MGGQPIVECVGLRSKMYSFETENGGKKTLKGISKVVKDKDIRHLDYRESLFSSKQMSHKQTRIMQEEHELYTVEKTSLSPLNDKKWITRDGDTFTTFSFGHYMIKDHELAELLIS